MRQPVEKLLMSAVLALALAACAELPSSPTTVFRTLAKLGPDHPGFERVLIIGVAGDFESRALFERTLADSLYSSDVAALAYHTVIGRRPRLTRAALETIITARKFDAVLLTRQKGQEGRDTSAQATTGALFDLFQYDYEVLNRAESIRRAEAITFVTEIYQADTQEKVWSIDSLSYEKDDATKLIRDQAAMIAAQIRTDRLLAR